METIFLANDIKVLYVTASSFPEGIMAAHQKLHSMIPFSTERKYFGISPPENGVIAYKAAAEEMQEGEAERLHCDTMILAKGNYTCIMVHDYMQDTQSIRKAFDQLLSHPGIDPNGYCVEWYTSPKDVRCMVRLAQ